LREPKAKFKPALSIKFDQNQAAQKRKSAPKPQKQVKFKRQALKFIKNKPSRKRALGF